VKWAGGGEKPVSGAGSSADSLLRGLVGAKGGSAVLGAKVEGGWSVFVASVLEGVTSLPGWAQVSSLLLDREHHLSGAPVRMYCGQTCSTRKSLDKGA
jgi:hypothetical protein